MHTHQANSFMLKRCWQCVFHCRKTRRREKGESLMHTVSRCWATLLRETKPLLCRKKQTFIERIFLFLFELHSTVSDSDPRDMLW